MYNKHKCDWYVVQIKPNSSRKALYNLQNQGFKTFYPQQEITIRRGNTFKKTKVIFLWIRFCLFGFN